MPSGSNYEKHTQSRGLRRLLIDRFNARLVDMIGHLHESPPESLLDVGCGEGIVLSLIGDGLPRLRLAGCDISAQAVARAQTIAPRADVVLGSAYEIPFPDHSFDLVLLSEVLEHLERPEQALAELARVARRHVIITVPHEPFFRLGNFASGKYRSSWGNHPQHIQSFGPASLRQLCNCHFRPLALRRSFPWLLYCGEVRR